MPAPTQAAREGICSFTWKQHAEEMHQGYMQPQQQRLRLGTDSLVCTAPLPCHQPSQGSSDQGQAAPVRQKLEELAAQQGQGCCAQAACSACCAAASQHRHGATAHTKQRPGALLLLPAADTQVARVCSHLQAAKAAVTRGLAQPGSCCGAAGLAAVHGLPAV